MIICEIQKQQYRALQDYRLTEQVGNKTSTEITVEVADELPFPQANDIITLKDGDTDTALFWGLCGIPKSPRYETGYEKKLYKIICGNGNYILSRRIVNEAYQTATVTAIVNDLFNKYISAEGISLGLVSDVPLELAVYTAKNLNLQECLNELATLVSAVWRVTPDRKFYFEVAEDFPRLPQVIGGDFVFGSLQKTTKEYSQRTVQYIFGGQDKTTLQTEIKNWTDDHQFTTAFPLLNKPSISYSTNGTTWIDISSNRIGVKGLNDDDDSYVFLFASGSNIVSYNSSTDYPITNATKVKIVYIGTFPIQVVTENTEKINEIAELTGTSGRKDNATQVAGFNSLEETMNYGNQLLQKYADVTEEIRWDFLSSTLSDFGLTVADLDLLKMVTFDLPQFNIEGSYVITEREITPVYITDAAQKYHISVKLMNRDYMKSYGETIAALKKDISQLSVRENDTIIKTAGISENLEMSEELLVSDAPLYYPSESLIEGSLVAPCDLGQTEYIYFRG